MVYKWTDADGVVHYSDQSVPGAQKIYTATSTTASTPAGATAGPAAPDSHGTGATKAAAALGYTEFAITSPAPDQTFYGDEAVGVRLTLEPDLKPNQVITWHLNGKQLEQGSTQFGLPRLDRGTYILAATITDQGSGESRTSDSVTCFVRQPSELGPRVQHH